MKSSSILSRLHRLTSADEGQAIVLVALGVTMLLLMAGLGVDVGYLEYQHQQMQKAADAGSVAGAAALIYGGHDAATTAAKKDTAANGFTDQQNGVGITVNNPPLSGPFINDNHYVEVIVAQARPTFFMKAGGFASVDVSARAVSSVLGNGTGCIYVMDPTDAHTYTCSGSCNLHATCGLKVRSSNSSAFVDSGGACTTAGSIGIVGGTTQDSCSTPAQGASGFSTGIQPFSDPLAYVAAPVASPVSCPVAGQPPAYPSNCTYSNKNGLVCGVTPNAEILPGTYCGGITISSSGVTATFKGGNYILAGGGLTVSGGANVVADPSGSGVMFYNTYNNGGSGNAAYSPIVISGGSGTTLFAPTSGDYQGILFFQDRTLTTGTGASGAQNTVSGGSGGSFNGALYFPTTPLVISGGSQTNNNEIIVSYTLTVSGDSYVNNNYAGDGQNPIHVAIMAE